MHICVIGSGVIGVSTAYALAESGHEVTLLDSLPKPAGLTSEANGGQLSYSYVAPLAGPGVITSIPTWLLRKGSPLRFRPRLDSHQWRWLTAFLLACNQSRSRRTTAEMLTLSYLSRDTLHAWMAKTPLEFNLRRNGKLIVYRNSALLDKAARLVEFQAQHGARQRVLSKQEVLDLEPSLASMGAAMAGAIYTEDEEAGDCLLFTQALYARLKNRPGVRCLMNTQVRRLRHEHGRITAIHTTEGDIQADAYVVACGMGSRPLLETIGQKVPIYGLKGYSLSIPLAIEDHASPEISITDYQQRIVYARLGQVLRIAAMVDIGYEDNVPNPDRVAGLKRLVGATFPHLDLSKADIWTGLRPATPSGKPIIGASPHASNLWLNIGHGALGFTLACGSAALLTALMEGRSTPIDPMPFQF